MSQVSATANAAASIDWTVVATGAALFIATLITTVMGWLQGQKKVQQALQNTNSPTSVVVQDNTSLREQTLVAQSLRDQLLITNHSIQAQCKATEDNTAATDDILTELKALRRVLEKMSDK